MQPSGRSGEVGENDNILTDVENINGGSSNDRLIGSASSNVIHGNAGNDVIYGMAGSDSIYGDAGKDKLFAVDSTKDVIDGGADADSASVDLLDLLSGVESVTTV
jgi:Ca2+-binding RTX toxin-like protein